MGAIQTFARKEIKFLLTEQQYQDFLPLLEHYMNPDKFCVGGKEYGIYNVYYDTPDDFLIRESLEKPDYKEKIRLRSYLSPAQAEAYLQEKIHPDLGGSYLQRAAYFGKEDTDFRLTFDRALTGRRSDLSLRQQSYGDLLIPEQMRLMEVKIADSMPMWLAEELAKLQVYKTSFSKYGKAYQMYVQNQLEWTRPQLTIEKRRRYDYA